MVGNKFLLCLDEETKAIINGLPKRDRSQFIRDAIKFYFKNSSNIDKFAKLQSDIADIKSLLQDLSNGVVKEKLLEKEDHEIDSYLGTGIDDILSM